MQTQARAVWSESALFAFPPSILCNKHDKCIKKKTPKFRKKKYGVKCLKI